MNIYSDLHWAAGLFEGEGTIYIQVARRKTKKGNISEFYILNISMTMTDEECVKEFSRIIGGWFGNHHFTVNDNRKRSWICNLSGNKALTALKLLQPYFRTERVKEKAEFAIKFQESRKNLPVSERIKPEYKAQQIRCYERMKELNRRGKVEA